MKTVKFIKDHFSGIKEGTEKTLTNEHAARLSKEQYVVITGEGEPDPDEKEFKLYKLTKNDIKNGTVGTIELSKEAKVGDEIEVPNPNYQALK